MPGEINHRIIYRRYDGPSNAALPNPPDEYWAGEGYPNLRELNTAIEVAGVIRLPFIEDGELMVQPVSSHQIEIQKRFEGVVGKEGSESEIALWKKLHNIAVRPKDS